jgi:tRNA-uridine 2-sulfurtransferase
VAAKDTAANVVTVVRGHDHRRLFASKITLTAAAWVDAPPAEGGRYKIRFRHLGAMCEGRVEGAAGGGFKLSLAEPAWGVAPGQIGAVYEGEVCLGGGVVQSCEVT